MKKNWQWKPQFKGGVDVRNMTLPSLGDSFPWVEVWVVTADLGLMV